MDYAQAYKMMKSGYLMKRPTWPGFRAAGLSEGQVVADSETSSFCGLSESGVLSMIRLTEKDLAANDWETVLSTFLPAIRKKNGPEKNFQNQKNQGKI